MNEHEVDDSRWDPVWRPWLIIFSSILGYLIVSDVAGFPSVVDKIYLGIHAPFMIYYWIRLSQIRDAYYAEQARLRRKRKRKGSGQDVDYS